MSYPAVLGSVRELFARSELVKYLVISNLKLAHQNLVLGYLWWLLDPLLWMAVYWLLVVGIFDRGEPDYPLFLLCAILPWRAFMTSIGQSMTCVSGQERLIKLVAFPKAVLPMAVVLSNGVNLAFGFAILILVAVLYGMPLTFYVLLLPFIAFIQLAFTAGLAFILSIATIHFADLQNIMRFTVRIWFYLSPGLYAVERVPLRFRDLYMLNPFAPIFTSYRDVIMYGQTPEWGWLAIAALMALATLTVGFLFFIWREGNLAKVI